MKKVCHMSSAHAQNDNRVFKKECVTLAKAGYEVHYVSRGISGESEGVILHGLGDGPEGRFDRIFKYTKKVYMEAIKIDADIYHFHDPELLPYGMKLFKQGKKVIFDSHEFTARQIDSEAKSYIPKPLRKIISKLYKSYESHVVKNISGVIIPCTCRGHDYFEGKYKNLALVNNVPEIEKLEKGFGLEKEPNTVCYIGAITLERGIVNTIKATKKAGCTLVLIGNIVPDAKEIIDNMPENDCVRYLGPKDVDEFPEILGHCIAGLSLLKKIGQYDDGDNLPTKIYEYMAMGLPVITTDFRMSKKIIEKYNCGICVNPDDVNEIAEAIKTLCISSEVAQEMGINGHDLVVNNYTWDIEKNNLLDLYKKIL